MANILALEDVAGIFRVTMDTGSEKAMLVHVSEQKAFHFKECGIGLYHININDLDIVLESKKTKEIVAKTPVVRFNTSTNESVNAYSFLSQQAKEQKHIASAMKQRNNTQDSVFYQQLLQIKNILLVQK